MDIAALASAMTGALAAQTQMAAAARMMKMNVQADAAIAKLVDSAAQNAGQPANLASGVGGALDISV